MTSNQQISVIVPVYNAASTLEECVESVLRQKYENWELILVNDGSTDDSLEICRRYADWDPRIQFFSQANKGVSSARNIALDHASGEWIVFVDSDDSLTGTALLPEDIETDADLIIYPYFLGRPDCMHESERLLPAVHNDAGSIHSFIKEYLSDTLLKVLWSKMFRSSLLHGIRFDERITLGEDRLFILQVLHKVSSIQTKDRFFYNYTFYADSMSKRYQMNVEKAVYSMYQNFLAYKTLDICIPSVERGILSTYRCVCQDDIDRDSSQWFKNPQVCLIFKSFSPHLTSAFKFKWRMLSFKPFSILNVFVKRFLR